MEGGEGADVGGHECEREREEQLPEDLECHARYGLRAGGLQGCQ